MWQISGLYTSTGIIARPSMNLLESETDGLAIDFTQVSEFDKETASQAWNIVRNASVDSFSSPHVFYTNSGTSPKVVKTSPVRLGWSPHNLGLRSEDLTTTWANEHSTESANAVVAPDGTTTADILVEDALGPFFHGISQNITIAASTRYTLSCYCKNNSGTRTIAVWLYDQTFAQGFGLTVDPVTGAVVTAASAIGSATVISSSVTDVGNGWFRVAVSGTLSVTTANMNLYLHTSADVGSYAGDGTSGIALWGMQLNRGIAPTAYIATTAAAKYGLPISYGEGLLVEPAATNLCLRSQDFSTTWSQTDTTRTSTNNTAPDNSSTATLMTEGTAGTAQNKQAITITANATYSISIFLKFGNNNFIRLGLYETATTTNRVDNWFNLSTGVMGTPANGGTGSGATGSITSIGNGWYRCTLTGAVGNGATAVTLDMSSASADGSATRVNAATYYVWGGQAETGTVATSYVPTVSASATRATDAPNVATSAYPHSATNGTFVAWITKMIANATNADRILTLSDGTANESFDFDVVTADTPDSIGLDVTDGGVAQVASGTTKSGSVTTAGNKAAFFYKLNDSGVLVDAGAEVADVGCTMPTVTNLQLGYSTATASRELNGFIKRLVYVPRRMTQAEMQRRTT